MTRSPTSHPLSRRTFAAGTAAGTLMAGLATHKAVAQNPAATPHPIVGTWLAMVTINEGEARPALLVYGADGSVLAPQPPSMPGFPGMSSIIFVSPAAGVWEAVDDTTASVTFGLLVSDDTGAVLGRFSFNSRLEVAADGMTYTQDYTATFHDAAGNVLPMGAGAATAERIVVEPMEMPEGATPAT